MKEVKTIGYDAKRIVSNATGLGSYSRTLLESLANYDKQFLLYAPNKGRKELYSSLLEKENLFFKFPHKSNGDLVSNKILQWLWREEGVVDDLLKDKVEVFHGLTGQLPKGIKQSGIKSIVTIHDLIFFPHPEWYSRIDVFLYKKKFFRTIKQADRIIAISECTKRDIIRYGNVDERKIEVIYQSYNPIFSQEISQEEKQKVKQKYSLPEKFILNVGTIERRKNVLLAVKALKEIILNNPKTEEHLVIVGRKTSYAKEVEHYIEQNGLTDRVHIINGVLFDELKVLYSLADLFVYPSIYEGFGIPIIEAIANRLPVVACKGSCLEEAGGEHSLYVEPTDVKAMAEAMQTLLCNEKKRTLVIEKGLQHIQKFANNDVSQKHIQLYNQLINNQY